MRSYVRWDHVAVLLAGAGLGHWMFGVRGAALFAAVALLVTGTVALVGARTPRLAAVLALGVAAAAFNSASTLGWGGADAPDGTRYKASPVGLSHVLTPRQLTSETVDCGWHPASGYATPCAVGEGGRGAFRRLRAVYPLVVGAVLLCLLGVVAAFASGRWLRVSRRLVAGAAALSVTGALVLFAGSVGEALAPLDGLAVGVGGTLGTMQLAVGLLACLAIGLAPPPVRAAAPVVR